MPEHQATYRILYRDIDSMGVLYYGRYLALFEMGRVEWLRTEGCRYRDLEQEQQIILPVRHAECDYRTPLKYDDIALIHTWIEAWTGTTLKFSHRIECAETGRICALGTVELACVAKSSHRPTRLPEILNEVLMRVVPQKRLRKRLKQK
ncbi:MAG: acyl-CoA thioesterase [Planctomycetes bacterium]|nr:acyl-CoA thioesterase [Planctomycetota bacterium]NQU50487.1 acyl-CoA thioesterase [Planctomycetota bacterium]